MIERLDEKFEGISIFINRCKPYNPNGRNQNEQESDKLAEKLKKMLIDSKVDFKEVDGDLKGYQEAYEYTMDEYTKRR